MAQMRKRPVALLEKEWKGKIDKFAIIAVIIVDFIAGIVYNLLIQVTVITRREI